MRLMQISIGGFDEQADRGLRPCTPGVGRRHFTNIRTAMIGAAIVAFVLQYSIACFSNGNHHDDLLAIMQLFLIQHSSLCSQHELAEGSVERTFLFEVYRVLGVNIDHSIDPQVDQLFRNQMIQRCLSMQMSLSYRGESKHLSLPAKVASTFLTLRYVSLIFAWAFKKPPGVPGTDSDVMNPGRLPVSCSH
jgi:mediator of RNA polymerase II transcription subunit 16